MKFSVRKYHKNDCVVFKSTKATFGGLSNMAPGFPIKAYGMWIRNSEALYQALRFPNHPEIQKTILRINSPITAKRYGRKYIDNTRKDWENHRFNIMRFCISVKLEQNKESFSKLLISTEGKQIVEFSDIDKVWGALKIGDYYEGTNALGRLLMELREKVLNDKFELEVPNIPNFRLLGNEIIKEDFNTVSSKA